MTVEVTGLAAAGTDLLAAADGWEAVVHLDGARPDAAGTAVTLERDTARAYRGRPVRLLPAGPTAPLPVLVSQEWRDRVDVAVGDTTRLRVAGLDVEVLVAGETPGRAGHRRGPAHRRARGDGARRRAGPRRARRPHRDEPRAPAGRRGRRRGREHLVAEEFAVLDKVGRLQLPHEFVEALDLRDRVRLGLEEDHVSVWPDRATGTSSGTEEESR